MEAIDFIKKNHKAYFGKINNEYLDEEGHNYNYYKNLYLNPYIEDIKPNNRTLKIYEYTNKNVYVPCLENPIINKIEVSHDHNIYCNYSCDYVEEINAKGKIIFNKTFPKLKKLICRDAIFNTIQPIEHLEFKYIDHIITKWNNYINNFNDLLIKLPNLKYLSFRDKIIYELKNNEWILKYNYKKNFYSILSINKNKNLKTFINAYFLNFEDINELTLNFYDNRYFDIRCQRINKNKNYIKSTNINISKVNNLIINTYYNITIKDIESFKFIKINKLIGNFEIYDNVNRIQLNTIYLNCFEIKENKICLKNNNLYDLKNIITKIINNNIYVSNTLNIINNLTNLILNDKLAKNFYNICEFLLKIFYDIKKMNYPSNIFDFYYFNYYKDINIKKIKNQFNKAIQNILKNNNEYLKKSLEFMQFLIDSKFKFNEDDNYFYLIKEN